MDDFEKRLKNDAMQIRSEVSPELENRIESSLRSVGRDIPVVERRTASSKLWWASSLTGLAMALLVIALVNWNSATTDAPPEMRAENPGETVPDHREYLRQLQEQVAPQPGSVEFANSLEEELNNLQADFEKVRENVARDIDFTF